MIFYGINVRVSQLSRRLKWKTIGAAELMASFSSEKVVIWAYFYSLFGRNSLNKLRIRCSVSYHVTVDIFLHL